MTRAMAIAALAMGLAACTSPEAERARGGDAGADIGNRGDPVVMHAGSQPFHATPHLIPGARPPTDSATQARDLSLSASRR